MILNDIHPNAKIGKDVKIDNFTTICDDVVIGDGTWVGPNVTIFPGARIGKNCKIFPGSVIAAVPQDLKFAGEYTTVEIGDNNVIRECCTINRGTAASGKTVIGNGNLLMAYVHIAHDCVVGDHCVFGYGVKIAGDCEIHNGAIFSSSVIQNANTRVGRLAMVQAGTTFSQDVPPFVVAGGKPIEYGGPNTTMMNNAGIDEKVQKHIANAYRLLFHGKTSTFDVIKQIKEQVPDSPEIRTILEFLENSRGIMCK